jgi:transposase
MLTHSSWLTSRASTATWQGQSSWRRTFVRLCASGVAPLRRFASGLHADYEAVKAGVTLPWSTGPVEGHINRLKMLKRSMFGRAKLDLLSPRFLFAA